MKAADLLAHYKADHGRLPTEAEVYRFRNPKRSSKRAYKIGMKRNFNEVSGGLPSLGKK